MCSACPQCDSKAFKRNGYTRHGKQNHRCLDCGRQFSLEPTEEENDQLGTEILMEKLSDCEALLMTLPQSDSCVEVH